MLAKILSQDETGERKVCLMSILFKIMELGDNLRPSARGNATCLRVETVSFLNAASSYTFGLGGGSSRAATVSAKPQVLWEPSQKGLLAECPQRQRLTVVRPARPNGRPSGSTSSKSPSMRSEPLWFTVILVAAIFSPENVVSSYRIDTPVRAHSDILDLRDSGQYFGTAGSTSSDHARMPPLRFRILRNPALRHDFARRIQLVYAARELAKRNQVSFEIADLEFVRLAHIQNEEIVAPVQARLQLARCNLRYLHIWRGSFFTAHAAEFVVIDQLVYGAMFAAHRAVGIFAQLQLAKLHGQRVEQQQTSGKTVAAPEDQFDGLHGLNRTDDSRQHAQHAALGARRHQPRRRRLWIQAAVARAVGHAEDSHLALEAKNRAIDVGLAQQDARVVHQITRGKIVRAIHDDIEILEQLKRVIAGQLGFECVDLNIGIEAGEALARGFRLGLADVAGTEGNLALQIGEINDVKIH